MPKKTVYQNHHPNRDKWPDFTIRLRKHHHLWVRRCEQMKYSPENERDLKNLVLALTFVYLLMMSNNIEGGRNET